MKANEFTSLSISYSRIDQLKPFARNARTHTNRQIRQIMASIREFGFVNPVRVDRNNRIIAGHGRVEAARLLGMTEVPTIRIEGLSEEQIRAFVIADNRLAELAGWDKSILAIELQFLVSLDNTDFDCTVTGFEVAEIDAILEDGPDDAADDVAPLEPDSDRPPVSEFGDVWLLDKHRVMCGNSLRDETYRALMGIRKANVVFSDLPYNVRIDGHATGNGKVHHREFAMASGEMTEAEYSSFLNNSLRLLAKYSTSGSVHYLFSDWRHVADFISAGKQNYEEFLNLAVWVKNSGGLGSFYRSAHELILIFRNGKGSIRNNVQLGRFARNRTNVWEYPRANSFARQGEESDLLALHPTPKPVAMVADAMLDCSARGEIALDPFLGSGTTLMAAERVGRICCGTEIDPAYVDVAIRRWQKHTGGNAMHSVSGKNFNEIAASKDSANV